jgi:cobalt-zinc-cadmium efflux system outer membrane protein
VPSEVLSEAKVPEAASSTGEYPRIARWAGRQPTSPSITGLQSPPEPDSAPGESLSIEALEQMALGNNPTLNQALRRVQALRGKYLQEGLYPNPSIGYMGEEIGDDGTAGQQGLMMGQQVITGGKLQWNRSVVSQEIAQAQQAVELQRQRIINDVRAAAYEVLTTQRTMELTEALVRIGTEGQEVAQELLKAREVSQVDLLQARIEANSAKVLLANARNDYQAVWRRLAALLGVPDLQPVKLNDDLVTTPPQLSWDEALPRLLAASPEMSLAVFGVERAQCELARQSAGRIPDVSIQAGARYNASSTDTIASLGISVPLQIFDRNQGNIFRARAELADAHQELRRVELSLQQRLAAAFQDYANARQQVQQYESGILPDAQESLGLIQQGYRQGEFGYLELLTSQRTFFRVNLDYVVALRNLWVSATRIEGMLLTGALDAPVAVGQ